MRSATLLLALCLAGCLTEDGRQGDLFFVRSAGADLPVWVRGATGPGVFVLVLPGGPGGSGLWDYPYSPGFQDLERDHALVYMDQRGTGSSQGTADRESISLQQIVDDTHAIVQALRQRHQVRDLFLAGHSFGGMVGTAYLLEATRQAGVRGWIEIDGAHNVKRGDALSVEVVKTKARARIAAGQEVDRWQGALAFYDAHPVVDNAGFLQHLIYLGAIYDPDAVEPSQRKSTFAPDRVLGSPLAGLAVLQQLGYRQLGSDIPDDVWGDTPLTRTYHQVDLTPQMGRITVPALVVWGERDDILPPAMADDALAALGTAAADRRKLIIPRTAHTPYDQAPGVFAAALREFLAAYSSR